MNRFLLIPAATIALIIIVGIVAIGRFGPTEHDVIHRLHPVILEKKNIKALVVEASGDPNSTAGPAFSMLMEAYLKCKETSKGAKRETLRARWPETGDAPRENWTGSYAIPVPKTVMKPPQIQSKSGLKLQLRDWEYGTVAEILHVGPYSSEDTSVAKLYALIKDQGYEICGPHEEEYLKSFGFFPVSPKKFLTIIRYKICKAGASQSPKK